MGITEIANVEEEKTGGLKELGEIARGLKHIAHLQDNITTIFVPIRY